MSEPAEQPVAEELGFHEALERALSGESTVVDIAPEPETEVTKPTEVAEEPTIEVEQVDESEKPDFSLPIDDEEAPEEEPVDTTGMTKKAGERFKELRTELKQSQTAFEAEKAARAQLESRVKELEGADTNVEALKQKLAEYESQFQVVKLEQTDAFKAAVTEPINRITDSLIAIATKYGIDATELTDAVSEPNAEKRETALEDLLDTARMSDKLEVYSLAKELPKILEKRADLYENADKALAELEAAKEKEQLNAAANRAVERKAASSAVVEKLTSKIPFLKTMESLALDAVKAKVEGEDGEVLPMANKVYNQYAGYLLPKLVKELAAARAELEAASDESDRKRAVKPSLDGKTQVKVDNTNKEMSFVDAIDAHFNGSRR